jgi:hypothetical protein
MMLAIDQYRQIHKIPGKHPRKELMDLFGRRRAAKIYQDKKDGSVVHVGYIVAGHWCSLYAPVEVKEKWQCPVK